MESFIAAVVAAFTLAGCACQPQVVEKVVVETKYVTTQIPEDHLDIPPQVPSIDITKMSQKDVAAWMIRNEERTIVLENNLKQIRKFQEDTSKLNAK